MKWNRLSFYSLLLTSVTATALCGCSGTGTGLSSKLDSLENRIVQLEEEAPADNINSKEIKDLVIIMKYGPVISYDKPTRKDAVVALGLLKTGEAIPALIEQFKNSKDNGYKSYIANSLGWIGDQRAVPILKKALKSKDVHLRKRASLALEKITGKNYPVKS